MKIKFLILAFLLAVFSLHAQPLPIYASQRAAGTNGIAQFLVTASTATNIGILIDCQKQKDVMVQVSSTNTTFWTAASVAGTLIIPYVRSVDGIVWESTLNIAGAPALSKGTNTTTWVTNLSSLGGGYIYIPYITNASDTGTNTLIQSIKYGIKIGAP